ncbi:MAG: hypothetical protein QOH88_27 [Verrucomicrobiota bacterium]|jgi:hypothetical protein
MALELVEPLIPDAQRNKAPELLLEAARVGFGAAAQFAQMRRQSEMEIQRLAQQDRLAEESHQIERERLGREFQLKQQDLENRRPVLDAQARAYGALAAFRDRRAIQTADGFAGATKLAERKAEVVQSFQNRMQELDLFNPNPKNPVEFYENAKRLREEYAFADMPEIKNAFADLDRKTQQHTLPLTIGNAQRNVPIGQIVENLQDPTKADETWRLLRDSGHASTEEDTSNDKRGWFEKLYKPRPEPVKRNVPDEILKPYLDQGTGVDFSHSAPRVLPGWQRSGRTAPATTPNDTPASSSLLPGDSSPPDPDPATMDGEPQASNTSRADLFQPSQVETHLQHARAAIANGAPMPAVAERLQSMSIDPNQLWAS